MRTSTISVRQYRRYFLWGLACSLTIFGVSATIHAQLSNSAKLREAADIARDLGGSPDPVSGNTNSSTTPPDPRSQQSPENSSVNLSSTIAIASLATSSASFVGFCFTAIVGWRRERRDGQHSELDIEKKKLELEKLRRDLYPKSPPPASAQSDRENA